MMVTFVFQTQQQCSLWVSWHWAINQLSQCLPLKSKVSSCIHEQPGITWPTPTCFSCWEFDSPKHAWADTCSESSHSEAGTPGAHLHWALSRLSLLWCDLSWESKQISTHSKWNQNKIPPEYNLMNQWPYLQKCVKGYVRFEPGGRNKRGEFRWP